MSWVPAPVAWCRVAQTGRCKNQSRVKGFVYCCLRRLLLFTYIVGGLTLRVIIDIVMVLVNSFTFFCLVLSICLSGLVELAQVLIRLPTGAIISFVCMEERRKAAY